MELYETLAARHSTRSFTGGKVPEDALTRILRAGRAAPVGMGRFSDVKLTVVETAEGMNRLRAILAKDGAGDALYGAPVFIAVASKEGPVGFLNAGAVIENMLLAAAAEGLGTCFIAGCLLGSKHKAELASVLKVPEGFEIMSGVALGVAAGSAPKKALEAEFETKRI